MKKQWKVIAVIILIGWVLTGCETLIEKETSYSLHPTVDANQPRLGPTWAAENQPPSDPPSPTHRPTQILTLATTATYVPALSTGDAEAKALRLLHDNGGCSLPCFWGFTPGQTQQQTLVSSLYAFDTLGGVHEIKISSREVTMSISLRRNYDDDPQAIVRWLTVNFHLSEGERDGWINLVENPFYAQPLYSSLPYLLSTYGPPAQAFVGVDLAGEMGMGDLFYLSLDYSQAGWKAFLVMPVKEEGGYYQGCPVYASTELTLWSPDDLETAKEYGYQDKDPSGFAMVDPLEEATSLTIEEFYQQFKDTQNTQCLEIPILKQK